MTYCTYGDVKLLTNISTSDVSNTDITSIISEATKELNRLINVKVVRERVFYVDAVRKNTLDSSNTTFYVQNWEGKFLADLNNDGTVSTDDVKVFQVDSNNTETELTVSTITHDEGKFVLDSAPTSGVRLYVTYEWSYKDVATPDPLVGLACKFLTAAYCYAKLNIGRAPIFSVGNKKIYRHMDSFEHYYQRFEKVVYSINDSMYASADSTETF